MKVRSLVLVAAAALSLTAPRLRAQDGLEGALATRLGLSLAAADFDRDNKADGAVLLDSGVVELHLSGRSSVALTFGSAGAANAVSALDIDHDGDTDVVVEQPFTELRLHVWLNDGTGGFQKGRVEDFPSPPPSRERLRAPSDRLEAVFLAMPPQRSDAGAPVVQRLPRPPSVSRAQRVLAEASLPALRDLSPAGSRAPPHSLSL